MLLSWLHHCISICVTTFRKQSRFQNGRRSGRGTRLRGGDAAWVAASKPEASLISVGSLTAVPKKLMPTMGYPGARSKTRCPENEVVAINQIGSPRRIVGGGHDGIELELANRRVNSVDARIAINGERLVIGKPTEDGLRVIGSRLKCIGKVKDVLIEEGHIGTGAGVIEIIAVWSVPPATGTPRRVPKITLTCPAKWLWVDLICTGCAPVSHRTACFSRL